MRKALLLSRRKSNGINGVFVTSLDIGHTIKLENGDQYMIKMEFMKKDEVDLVAEFISQINSREESHIGYCGKESIEIAHSLREDLSDIAYGDSFLTVYQGGELVGVIGFDADFEANNAEIWGPFVKEDKWDVVHPLWSKLMELIPAEIKSVSMFPNKHNKRVLQLVKDLSFDQHSDQTILTFKRDSLTYLDEVFAKELEQEFYSEMKQLHDHSFPDTYYSGQQIINRLNRNRKVFITENNGQLSGYIYAEAEPAFGEASIEFFAVKASERGKGLGSKLLTVALRWLFTIESIQSITLCVNSSNQKAIRLYQRVGFQPTHELCYFTKNI